MVTKAPKIASLCKKGQGVDRANPGNGTQELIVKVIRQELDGALFDLLALPDKTSSLRQNHAEHVYCIRPFIDRQADGLCCRVILEVGVSVMIYFLYTSWGLHDSSRFHHCVHASKLKPNLRLQHSYCD